MRFDLDALTPIGDVANGEGVALQLAVDAIDEDPGQPRQEFDAEPLQELAASIAERGVLQAISVRRHPEREDRWMLNFGARRLRASKLAGRSQIPAFVNETASSYDQVIENEQREGLKPLELALFVQRRLAGGESQTDIARQLSKSRAYVTYAMALIDAPDWLMSAYREGRCRGLRELYELRRLHDAEPEAVEAWLSGTGTATRADLQQLKNGLQSADSTVHPRTSTLASPTRSASALPAAVVPIQCSNPAAPGRPATLWGNYDGSDVMIDLSGVPGEDGHIFVLRQCDRVRMAVLVSQVKLLRVVPAVV